MYTQALVVDGFDNEIYFLKGNDIVAANIKMQDIPLIPRKWLDSYKCPPETVVVAWNPILDKPETTEDNEIIVLD